MPAAMTDTVLNYSGMLYSSSDNSTRLLNAIYARGKRSGDGIVRTGVRKVNAPEFALSSNFSIPSGAQPNITENASLTAPEPTVTTRDQQTNCIQIYQQSVAVSYLKQSAVGAMAGINIVGQKNNVANEFDFQVAAVMAKMRKDLNFTNINGVYQKGTNNTTAWKSKGLVNAITSNAIEYQTKINSNTFNAGMTSAMENGFVFNDGALELWVNPKNLKDITDAYLVVQGFNQPDSRTTGGVAIQRIYTDYGILDVNYDKDIPADTFLLLDMSELAVAELDVPKKGNFFYEDLAKTGASGRGQLYGQAGLDFGAEQRHILWKKGM